MHVYNGCKCIGYCLMHHTLIPVTRISCSVLCSVKGGASRWMDHHSVESEINIRRVRACECEDQCMIVRTNGTLLIDGLSNDVQNAPQWSTSDGHLFIDLSVTIKM